MILRTVYCPRCGTVHEELEFCELSCPIFKDLTHWATCPTNKEPIFLQIVVRPVDDPDRSKEGWLTFKGVVV